MEELISTLLFALMGGICFLYYRSIKGKTGGWLLTNKKVGSIGGMIIAAIAIFLLTLRACNKG